MAGKFHINPETGTPGVCTASVQGCRYGSEAEHHSSPEDAQYAYEASMSAQTISTHSKSTPARVRNFDLDEHIENPPIAEHAQGVAEIYKISGQLAAAAEDRRKLDGADAETLREVSRMIDEVVEETDFSNENTSHASINRIDNFQSELNRRANETEDPAKATALFRASEGIADVLIKIT